MPLLEVKNLNTGYGKKQVLFDVSLEIEQGEIVLLIGSNGSGKSTVLKAIYGLLPMRENEAGEKGKIFFDGEDITSLPASALLKKGLLYVPQKDNLFPELTVKENLEMAGLTLRNRELLRIRTSETLDTFPLLVPLLNRIPMKLSGGERQMLTLAMTTLHNPKMMLLDEPFAGLSPHGIGLVRDTVKRLHDQKNVTFLIVEHNIKETSIVSSKIISLKLGKIYATRFVNTDLDFQSLQEVFV